MIMLMIKRQGWEEGGEWWLSLIFFYEVGGGWHMTDFHMSLVERS